MTIVLFGALRVLITFSAKAQIMRSVWFVCHSFCLSMYMITAKVISQFCWNLVLLHLRI